MERARQRPDTRISRHHRRPAHDRTAGAAAAGRRRRAHAGGHRKEPLVRVLGCAARHARRPGDGRGSGAATWTDRPTRGACARWPALAGGHPTRETVVPVKAAGRVVVAEGKAGSIAAFPPPHTFFFTREVDTNLGYVWYRKDAADRFGIGIRQADREENPQYVENFALFNAPPGTKQRMGVYFLANAAAAA